MYEVNCNKLVHDIAWKLEYVRADAEIVAAIQSHGGKTMSAPMEAARSADAEWEKWKNVAEEIVRASVHQPLCRCSACESKRAGHPVKSADDHYKE